MTRGQYLAMCAIGFVALGAFLRVTELQRRLNGGPGFAPSNKPVIT